MTKSDDKLVGQFVAAIDEQANRRPTGEGLVYSYGEVQRGIAAALQSQRASMEGETLNDIAVMMSEFIDNWPNPKRIKTALALIAKTMRVALDPEA